MGVLRPIRTWTGDGASVGSVVAAGMACLGLAIFLLTTRWGVDLDSDAQVYVTFARNFLQGYGLGAFDGQGRFVQTTHYPPGYPLLLAAAATVAGVEVASAARWVQAAAFGATILGVCLVVARHSRTWSQPLIAGLSLIFGGSLLFHYTWALSEGTFMVWGGSSLVLLGMHVHRPRLSVLVLASLATAAAVLTRYIGLSLIGVALLLLLLDSKQSMRRRYAHALVFAVLALAPIAVFLMSPAGRLASVAQPGPSVETGTVPKGAVVAERAVGLQRVTLRQWSYAPLTVARWLVPEAVLRSSAGVLVPIWSQGGATAMLLLILCAAALGMGAGRCLLALRPRHRSVSGGPSLIRRIVLTFLAVYLGSLLLTMYAANPSTEFSLRTLAPVYVALVVLLPGALAAWWGRRGDGGLRHVALGGLFVLVAAGNFIQTSLFVRQGFVDGLGVSSIAWQRSSLLERVRHWPATQLIYTNGPVPLALYTDRLHEPLPEVPPNGDGERYQAELRAVEQRLMNCSAVLVYFDSLGPPRSLYAGLDELRQRMQLEPLAIEADGGIYTIEGCDSTLNQLSTTRPQVR